jgi:hypothetical protein
MYDYYLGGKDNYPVDREYAEFALKSAPDVRRGAQEHRALLGRMVTYLAKDAGIRQFIDIGTGLPTQENVHQVVYDIAPESTVIYVDNDPQVLAHARALLAKSSSNTHVVEGDLRNPDAILDTVQRDSLIDFSRPVAVLLFGIMHFISDDDGPAKIVGRLRDRTASGSYIAMSHIERDKKVEKAAGAYDNANASLTLRDRDEIAGFFDGYRLVEPGMVYFEEWRNVPFRVAGEPEGPLGGLCALGQKP